MYGQCPGSESTSRLRLYEIFTNHSHAREKLHQLVPQFDCGCREGRAASAPTLRKGASSKVTMAQADVDDGDDVALAQRALQVQSQEEEETGPPRNHHSMCY